MDGLPPILGRTPRLLPTNPGAEQAFLGALLTNNTRVADKCQFLCPFHFSDPVHGKIFERAMARIDQGQTADALTLKSDFENTHVLDDVGGIGYVIGLMGGQMGWMSAGDYAKAIYDTWLRRELIAASEEMSEAAYGDEPGADVEKMVSAAAESILALGEHSTNKSGADFATVARGAPARAEAALKGVAGHSRLDTGIASIDKLWGGLWPGELYYLMARSRTGKTPAMSQIVRNVAAALAAESEEQNTPVGHVHVFSLEMTNENLVTTNLASITRWDAEQIKSGKIDDYHEFSLAAEALARLPIVFDDEANMDLPGLVMKARAVARQKRTRLICIDYREMVRRGREHARMQLPEWIPFLGYQLKALAKACNVPVIALAQINKSKDKAEDTRPLLGDLPYDGGQAADGVFALHRPELYMGSEPPPAPHGMSAEKQAAIEREWHAKKAASVGVTEFHALKRRFGPTGTYARLHFDGPRMLLSECGDNANPSDAWV